MRGALLIAVVIATLIVGMLVIKNMQSGSGAKNVTKKETIEHVQEAAKDIQNKLDESAERLDQSF